MKRKKENESETELPKKKPLIPEDDSFLEIDKFALDKEWVDQPKLYQNFSRIYARCIEKRDNAKSALKLVEAQLKMDIRENPENYGIRKAVNDAVEEAMTVHPTYQNAVAALNKAEYNVALLKGTCESLGQRKSALEYLVKLHGAEYFAEPIADEDSADELDKRIKKRIRTGK